MSLARPADAQTGAIALSDVRMAAERIRGVADGTPLVPSALSDKLGCALWLKLETCQPTGAFKLRGAMNALRQLGDVPGVICCSTGNHGRAVAYAARMIGLRAVVCLGRLVPQVKIDGIRALGAEVVIHGESQDAAQQECLRLAKAQGLVEVSPFDDAAVIAGQGTIALEMLAAQPSLDTLLVPLSGGGLAAGIATAAKAIKPGIRIIGLTMERGAAMQAAMRAGRPVEVQEVESLADSLGGGIGMSNHFSFPICRALLDDVVLLSEEEIYRAMQALYFEDRMVAEGASVVGVAALLSGKVAARGHVGTVITGRNVDMAQFTRVVTGQDICLGDMRIAGVPYGA
ncbi:hydroxyectoine utilization dehydratase EutB [Pseudooceanicola sediminis]|uniref:Hydroxyectoine utilization dehydratase EutB n=1 Tax=Pseudooceanicola sediminis TaxID=2211117 RepID=A0A399J5A1_9RHOB|nr:hydroxyectoine utilization dehydratase EutB [Pseudooceanicola sediminis]KAA2317140.1 hydroxyectoine utilization dehydratase EutB [Puniceibacterium sp. HSS470]RII40511.1 hydroxyectoine utilization dehydratase EutB [Pseudooceanicola sediminis]|tara:strand:+ start:111068 stop:112099 length:1032 start_codon:yes stop_codon:yes gene_type:complete